MSKNGCSRGGSNDRSSPDTNFKCAVWPRRTLSGTSNSHQTSKACQPMWDTSQAGGVGVGVGVGRGAGLNTDVSVAVGIAVGVAVGVEVAAGIGVAVGVGGRVAVGIRVGVWVGVGVNVGVGPGIVVGVEVGRGVALAQAVIINSPTTAHVINPGSQLLVTTAYPPPISPYFARNSIPR